MNTEKIKEIINQYFDNELSKGEEAVLFTQLSQDQEAREYFKDMSALKNAIDSSYKEFPDKLDEKILTKIPKSKNELPFYRDRTKIFSSFNYVFALLLIAVSIFFYTESVQYRERIDIAYEQVNQQNRMINGLINTLPQAEVKAVFTNQAIVTPKM